MRGRLVLPVVLLLALAACGPGASPSPSVAPSATATASASPEPSAPASVAASAQPSATAASSAAPNAGTGALSLAASFDDHDLEYASAVVPWGNGFAAIGHYYDADFVVESEPNGPLVWTSADGLTWNPTAATFGVTGVQLFGLAPLDGGDLLAIGNVGGSGVTGWTSPDATSWTQVVMPMTSGPYIPTLAHGEVGYVMGAGAELWHSSDGAAWTLVHQLAGDAQFRTVAAGDEGFVVHGVGSTASAVLASGNGTTWFTASDLDAGAVLDIAPLGGDWLAAAYHDNPSTIMVWRSANGLDWTTTTDVNDLTGPTGPKAGIGQASGITNAGLLEADGRAFLTLSWNHCCAQVDVGVGVWSSTDGATWTAALPADVVAVAGADNGGASVLVGYLERGADAAFWAVD